MKDEAYLETTAVIDLVINKDKNLKSILTPYSRRISSQYALMEIKRGYLNNLVLLHNKIVEANKWSDVQDYVSRLTRRPNQLGTILGAFTRFWQAIEQNRPQDLIKKHGNIPLFDILKKESLAFISVWIGLIFKKIDKLCDERLNPMNCYLDIIGPAKKGDKYDNLPMKCRTSTVECKIKNFFIENKDDFEAIRKHLMGLPENEKDAETNKRISSLKSISKTLSSSTRYFSNHSQNEELCWNCGDAIHALIPSKDVPIVNRNKKHFDPICKSIGRTSLTY